MQDSIVQARMNKEKSTRRLQNSFHRLLELFLYGAFLDAKSKIFFPFLQSQVNSKYEYLINDINKETGSDVMPLNNKAIAHYIVSSYRELEDRILRINVEDKKDINIKRQVNEGLKLDKKYSNLINLRKYLNKKDITNYVESVLIHGSYSTQDYEKNISDLDALIVLKNEVLYNPSALLELQKIIFGSLGYFYRIDSLQHHGYFVLTMADLAYYPEVYYPVELFNYTTHVIGSKKIKVYVRDSRSEALDIYDATMKYLLETNKSDIRNLFDYKMYFQVLQLIPIAYLQAKGKQIYKKHSFSVFCEEFPEYKELFDELYSVRLGWEQLDLSASSSVSSYSIWFVRLLYYVHRTFSKKSIDNYKFIDNKYKGLIIEMKRKMDKNIDWECR